MGFLRQFVSSLNFFSYTRLSDEKLKSSFKYLAKLVLVFFILSCLLSIPKLITLSNEIDDELDKFSSLTVTVNSTQEEPITLFENNYMITIDTGSNATDIEEGKMLITSDYIIKKRWFGTEKTSIQGYSNVLEHKNFYKGLVFILVALAVPGVILFGFLFYLIKYLVFALILSFILLVVMRLIKSDISYKQILNISIYALTIAVVVELLLKPFGVQIPFIRIEGLAVLLGVVQAALGLSRAGISSRRGKKIKKGYIEME